MLEEAFKALNTAEEELNLYFKTGDLMKLRDAAEKGWLAVNKAIEALLEAKVLTAKTYREKRDTLRKLRFKVLVDKYAAKISRIDCFYDSFCDASLVREELEKVKEIIDEIKKLL